MRGAVCETSTSIITSMKTIRKNPLRGLATPSEPSTPRVTPMAARAKHVGNGLGETHSRKTAANRNAIRKLSRNGPFVPMLPLL